MIFPNHFLDRKFWFNSNFIKICTRKSALVVGNGTCHQTITFLFKFIFYGNNILQSIGVEIMIFFYAQLSTVWCSPVTVSMTVSHSPRCWILEGLGWHRSWLTYIFEFEFLSSHEYWSSKSLTFVAKVTCMIWWQNTSHLLLVLERHLLWFLPTLIQNIYTHGIGKRCMGNVVIFFTKLPLQILGRTWKIVIHCRIYQVWWFKNACGCDG